MNPFGRCLKLIGVVAALFFGVLAYWDASAESSATCKGKFMNPITDICWSCAFPIKLGGASIVNVGLQDDNGSGGSLVCNCNNQAGVPQPGVRISFWEPARLVEVVRSPYCFPSLGGAKLDMGINAPDHGGDPESGKKNLKTKFYQVHWYMNPLMFWLEVLIDSSCLEQQVFDLAYITEVDPLWADDEATFVLNPDAALFTNIIAQAACMGDCVAATAGMPLNELFWCVGCQGSMYPLTGWVGSVYGGVQASSLLVARFTNKMHREFLIWAGGGSDGLCGYYPQPLMDKQNYKFQMVYPVRQTEKIAGKCCQPFGRSDILWGAGKEFPYTGEDFSYQIFRQRTCCQGKSIQ